MGKPVTRVLLADDNEAFRTSLCEILEENGFTVTEAAGGMAASSLFTSRPFDILITDILMPDKDGLELLNEIRSQGLPFKVIVITGGGQIEAEDYLRIIRDHPVVSASFKKPLNPEELISTMHSLSA